MMTAQYGRGRCVGLLTSPLNDPAQDEYSEKADQWQTQPMRHGDDHFDGGLTGGP